MPSIGEGCKIPPYDMSELNNQLFEEILQARQRVYAVGSPTPLQELCLPDCQARVFVKREDLGPIKAYKWRGAYNCMAKLPPEERARGVVAASAGNHAQGVALAAARLGCRAHIFMPRSTPQVKQNAVRMHGGEHVHIVLTGDSYDAASAAAHAFAEAEGLTFVHPYDDLRTMGGQGTLADEVVMSGMGSFDRVYLQIGGGGLAAGCACWFKHFWPQCRCIGVEGVEQASMKLAVESGSRGVLPYVDVFCDGTAVRQAGEYTFEICRELLDGFVTVSNEEVCRAIRTLWTSNRTVTEPSGAMGLAALLQDEAAGRLRPGEKCLVVLSGANMDFSRFGVVAARAGVSSEPKRRQRYLQIPMVTRRGEILKYLENIPEGVLLTDVQYGRLAGDIQHPVFGVLGTDEQFEDIRRRLARFGLEARDVTNDADVRFRMISYDRERLHHPVFFVIEFPERPGAFTEFMRAMGEYANLCYFNYQYSGELVGRALVGLEFASREDRDACRALANTLRGTTIQSIHELPDDVRHRVLDRMSPAE